MSGSGEHVVLCAADGSAAGTALKATVHHRSTPLHLAFSCYVFDASRRVLLTRRARHKATFPGVRSNSCCGHPAPGEGMRAAVTRRLDAELGVVPARLQLLLPAFGYRAAGADGTVENELCPVYLATLTAAPALRPDAAEVADAWWVPWADLAVDLPGDPVDRDPLSPWCKQQIPRLRRLGADPFGWPAGEEHLLPAAATP